MQENTQILSTPPININNKDERINVVVRIRGKKSDENESCSQLIILDNKSIQLENKTYYYDYVANMNSTQEEMFQHCAKKICDNSLKGYNCTIFAYGQTGSGKTFTLLGKNITKYSENKIHNFSIDNTNIEMNELSQDNDLMNLSMNGKNNTSAINSERKTENINQNLYNYDINDQGIGLLPRIIYYLFNNSKKTENIEFKFKISYLEIYQESISDLLNPNNSGFVQLRDLGTSIILDGLRKLIISSPDEALRYIIQGNKFRHTASTLMNSESSRSHAVISIYIEKIISQNINNSNNKTKIQKSVFHVIDLAGSERQKKTGAYGERTKEAGVINCSLLNLSNVIRNIINNQKQIPYRNSKLTHLLKDSLGGNAKTSIIATVSPFDSNIGETKSTLAFAQNAKKVKNHAMVNEVISGNENMKEMKILEKYNSILEENIRLKEQLLRIQNNNNNISYSITSAVEGFDRGIDDIIKDIHNLKEQKAKLKDKVEKSDLEIKIRGKRIETLTEQIKTYIQNIKTLMKEKNDYIAKNIILSGQLKEEENEKINLEKHYKDQISLMEQNYSNTEQIINNKKVLIDELTKKMEDYLNQLAIKDKQINELNVSLEQKNSIINDINSQKFDEKQKIENLSKTINKLKIENELKQKEIDELTKNNNEIKDKGKNLLKKYDENINKNSDEIVELKNIIRDRDRKLEKAKKLYHNLEEMKLLVESKLQEKSNIINSYLGEISELNQTNRILMAKYDSLKIDYDKISLGIEKNEDNNKNNNNSQPFSKNNVNERLNNFQVSKKNFTKRNNTRKFSKSPVNNNLSSENLKYKKYYEELKQKYDTTLKSISGGKKLKTVQDLLDKINNIEKDLNECRRIMNSSFNKIQDILTKDIFISGISSQPLEFNYNSFDSTIEQKFFVIFEKFIEFHMILENQLKNMNEQNEILNHNIQLNDEKKELFELNNDNNSISNLISSLAYKSIAKNRKGNLFKNLSTNTKKAFDGYSKEIPEDKKGEDIEKENNPNIINNIATQGNANNNILNLFGNKKNEN